MFASIRRHQSWIWLIVVVLVSISMVWFFTPDAGMEFAGQPGAQGDFGSIDGRPVAHETFRNAYREIEIGYFLRTGELPGTDEQAEQMLEREALSRVFLLQKARELDISPSDKAVGRIAQERIGDYPYDRLEQEVLLPKNLTLEDFERFLRHEAAIQQVVGVAALSGKLVNPREAEFLFRKETQEKLADIAVFWASNYLDKVAITNGAVGQFFTNRMGFYRVPERMQIRYVEFAASNYLVEAEKDLSDITNLTARLDEAYLQLGREFFKDTNDVVLSEAAAKERIKEDELRRRSLIHARRAAAGFGGELMDQPQPNQAENLDRFAAAKGYAVQVSPPFDRMQGLEGTSFPPDLRNRALSLTAENPIIFNPIPGTNAVYVIALKNRLPSEMPPFETVEEKVTGDYKQFLALEMARKAGLAFHTNLTNGLQLKASFQELAQGAGVQTVSLPPFSASTATLTNIDPRINFQMVQRYVSNLKPGEATSFIPTTDGGMIVYFRQEVPLTDEKVREGLPEFIGRLRQYRQNESFSQWFRQQALTRITAPKREQAPPPQQQ